FFKNSTYGKDLEDLKQQVNSIYSRLQLQISVSTYDVAKSSTVCSPPQVPLLEAFGIDQQISEIVDLLEWNSDKPAVAVVVHGIGGAGKTTLANSVYASLNLQGWRHSKVTLVQNLEVDPNIKKVQSDILEDLTGTKQIVRDCGRGREKLKYIIEKESVFLYIDNVLRIRHLKDLLPNDLTARRKLRLLVTARKINVSSAIENCCDKEYSFDENRILFSYNDLEESAKEAFLDICSFFYDWKWFDVACIVGEEELKCLEGGGLVKRMQVKIFHSTYDITMQEEVVSVHDLILAAGRNIAKDSRFSRADDFITALERNEKVDEIKGVWLERRNTSQSPICIPALWLDRMSRNLRVFSVDNMTTMSGKCKQVFTKLKFVQVGKSTNSSINLKHARHLRWLQYSSENNNGWDLEKLYTVFPLLQVVKCEIWNSQHVFADFRQFIQLKQLDLHGYRLQLTQLIVLRNLEKLRLNGFKQEEIPETIGKLRFLQELELSAWENLQHLPISFINLFSLKFLSLKGCKSLKELPNNFSNLSSLGFLSFEGCASLSELPSDFHNLSSLKLLNLTNCSNLISVPENIGNIPLKNIKFEGCKKLMNIPKSIGGLKSLCQLDISFDNCSSLKGLPDEICQLTTLETISLCECSDLKILPSRLSELTCLQTLTLNECACLEEFDFQGLIGLTTLHMRKCDWFSSLPGDIIKLTCLMTLDLSGCSNLKQLCNDFHCLGALKILNLSECTNLIKLPNFFGKLGGLEILNLSKCSKLEDLSEDFHNLPFLIKLDLSNCKMLGKKWMDSVGSIQSLWLVDVCESDSLIQRWTEMQREEEWHLVVVTNPFQVDRAQCGELMLEIALSKLCNNEGFLIDKDQRPFCFSSLLLETHLIFIIDDGDIILNLKQLERNLNWLECRLRQLKIIYIGSIEFHALPHALCEKILACTPCNSKSSSFLKKLFYCIGYGSFVFLSKDGLDRKCIKHMSMWDNISYILDEVDFIARTPRDNNIELLRALLVTRETDYLLLKNKEEVKVEDLQGKVVLLLLAPFSILEVDLTWYKNAYLKIRNDYKAEVVWIPEVHGDENWDEFENAATKVPWLVVPNPWITWG
ncbi:hypothetical protein KI387_034935, partial [Taxus chinensis]